MSIFILTWAGEDQLKNQSQWRLTNEAGEIVRQVIAANFEDAEEKIRRFIPAGSLVKHQWRVQ